MGRLEDFTVPIALCVCDLQWTGETPVAPPCYAENTMLGWNSVPAIRVAMAIRSRWP
jgi:hypothetical protein